MSAEGAPRPALDFRSPEEFAQLCDLIAARLHYINRVAASESCFVWEMAQLMRRMGRVFADNLDDAQLAEAFGDGWRKGTLTEQERRALLVGLLFPDFDSKR